jgi:glycosyltransferase involved in cell wall biosynthesis
VDRISPDRASGGALSRILFNLALPARLDPSAYDLVVGFDLDGCFLGDLSCPRVTALKGIMADEKRFERGWTRLRFSALARLEGRAARRADRVVVTSEYCRDVAVGAYGLDPDRVSVVPEGIDLSRWQPSGAEDAPADGGSPAPEAGAREAAPPAATPPVVLSVARQYPRKNTATLVRAFRSVRVAHPRARLRVVGDGPELPRLRELAARSGVEEAVDFLGRVEDPADLRREYRRADVFCLPSLQEGFGIVFLEAMASGLPVVAGDAAAVPEVVPHGEAGLLVAPRDEAALAAALERLLDDPGLREEMGEAGRRRARDFGWDRVARRFLRVAGPGAATP